MAAEKITLPDVSEAIARLGAYTLTNQLLLKFLVAELAAINRTPEEATKFANELRGRLENFAELSNPDDTDTDRRFKDYMLQFTRLVFDGISFGKNK